MIEAIAQTVHNVAWVVFGLIVFYLAARLFFAAYFKSRNEHRS